MRSSKELAKRLRFEPTPRHGAVRRLYLGLALLACLGAVGLWAMFTLVWSERQYAPGPVSAAHATFGRRCADCHTRAFAAVPDSACRECHSPPGHSEFETRTPACRECHIEHRGTDVLSAKNTESCVDCHGDLHTRRSAEVIAAQIADFAAHPTFVPLRSGFEDAAAIRFNHRMHLESAKIPADLELDCGSCHQVEEDGGVMKPIVFETHCRDCHRQAGLGPLGDIEAPHEAPDQIRRALAQQLVSEAVSDPQRFFGEGHFLLPGRKRGAIDQSSSLAEFQTKWLDTAESLLYAPFVSEAPLEQNNRHCFLCHQGGERSANGLPVIRATAIPRRWLERARFSHQAHELVACRECHAGVSGSRRTEDVNLPGRELCQQCHVDRTDESAGTRCTLCHLYHEHAPGLATAGPARPIDVLTGLAPPENSP